MKCTINDVNLSFDRENRLRNTITRICKHDIDKQYVLASLLSDDRFKKFVTDSIRPEDVLKGEELSLFLGEEDYVKLNQNRLGALLNAYYLDHYFSVENSKTNKSSGRLNGFSSGSAKMVAKQYTASMLIDEYRKEIGKSKDRRRSSLVIIRDVNDRIARTFYKRATDFAAYVINGDGFSEEAKDCANEYLRILNDIAEFNRDNAADNEWMRNQNELYKNQFEKVKGLRIEAVKFAKAKDKASYDKIAERIKEEEKTLEKIKNDREEIRNRIRERNKRGAALSMDRHVISQNLVNLYSDDRDEKYGVRLRNFANLVSQTKGDPNGWYFQVFNTKTMTSIMKEFNNVGNVKEYFEQDDIYKSFEQAVSSRVRMVLSSVPKLADRFNETDGTQALDTNNELGVPTYMSSQFLTVQIFSFGNFNSTDALIKSLEQKSRTMKSLYGLGQVVDMMKKDRAFANELFVSFAKPVGHKTMVTVSNLSNREGIKFNYSNPTAFPLTDLIFRLTNKLRATYSTAYNINDLQELESALQEYRKSRDERKKAKETLYNRMYNVLNKYFPNFDKTMFSNYFDNIPDRELYGSANRLAGFLFDIIKNVGKLKDRINKQEKRLSEKNKKIAAVYYSAFDAYTNGYIPQPPAPPEYKHINYAEYDLDANIYSAVINLSKMIVGYTDSRARLNTANAEGKSGSDVLKNCYVTRLFEQIEAGSDSDPDAGLKALLNYVTKGTEGKKENQYSNDPLLFGVKDENGRLLNPGMFIRTATGYEISRNAKDILKYSLFDGTKNTQDGSGVTYSTMSKLDFFITQYKAFEESTREVSGDAYTYEIGNMASAVYPMRIGSDSPKIFFIRAPRYTDSEVRYAIYGHVMDELNMLASGLTAMFEHVGDNVVDGKSVPIFKTRTDISRLIGRAFYDEKEALRIKKSGGSDFTSAIVKDGKLTGNLFKFVRLFETGGYNAGKDIEALLSLYGDADKGGLLSMDSDGRMRLTPNGTVSWDSESRRFTVNLSSEQKAALKSVVRKWCDLFLSEAESRSEEFVKVLNDNGIKYDKNVMRSFIMNTVNMNMAYDDLFEGDFKFYNGARDFLKRTKEAQAGGDGYAAYDLLEDDNAGIHDLKTDKGPDIISYRDSNRLDANGSPVKENVTINGKTLTARSGFRAVTIYNTVKASDYAVEMQEKLERDFITQGMDPETAKKRSVKIASGYGFSQAEVKGDVTKINDAQSYITLEEFIRRRYADGTIDEYADLIRQLTDDTPVEKIDLDRVNARIQVQKNFYFDKVFDKDTGLYYPRQIKNAEFVIIPKLFPEGSELRKIHDWMVANDIGQLNTEETSKAAKKNVLMIWDAETGEFHEDFAEQFNPTHVEEYRYKYLYKQQDVQEHMADRDNKAGTQLVKKIMDNIISEEDADNPERKKLKEYAEDFQNAYTANIEESFTMFLDAMDWEYDRKTGRIVNAKYATTDANGNRLPESVIKTNRETLNFGYFWQRGREEAARLGMDSNFMEYLIPDEFGKPVMGSWMNSCASKLESIAQAIYNSKVTRQTFPGWHAAQITGVGYSKKLKMDVETGVMEVYLPRWSKLIPKGKTAEEDAEILRQIQEEGLDIHLGYRIPTEGKQSISVMKVVGFTDECLGSTIVVPDDWVIQTGSDFDVDSIYGVCWEMYRKREKDGRITLHKIPFEKEDVNDEDLYVRYVNDRLDSKVKRTDVGEEIDNAVSEIKDRLNNREEKSRLSEQYKKIREDRDRVFKILPGWVKGIVTKISKEYRKDWKGTSVMDTEKAYPEINKEISGQMKKRKLNDEEKAAIEEYMDLNNASLDIINARNALPEFDREEYSSQKAEAIKRILDEAERNYREDVRKAAEKAGLMSFDEFSAQTHERKLDRRARNNLILDRMIKIMNSNNSREEQYGRSQFDSIVNGKDGANDIIDRISGESSRPRSPYSPFDQLDYMEDVMGGRALKALSVNWDSFCSRNNWIRTVLSNEDWVDVVLNVGDKSAEDSAITYDEKEIRKSYGLEVRDYNPTALFIGGQKTAGFERRQDSLLNGRTGHKRILFHACRIGWSDDNRNITGDLVTNYTAQTTAYHHNVVKMGSIPNVNKYTFSVYKLLPSMGIDYETTIGFIRQPIVSRVANNNLTKSVFVSSDSDPINIKMALVDIADRLGLKNGKYDFTSSSYMGDIIETLKLKLDNAFTRLFGISLKELPYDDIKRLKVPLDKEMMFARIKRDAKDRKILSIAANSKADRPANFDEEMLRIRMQSEENAAFDLAMLFTFKNIRSTAENINKIIMLMSIDKKGAATTIHETRRMMEQIEELREDMTLTRDGKSIIDLVLPRNEKGGIDVERSAYKSVAAVYACVMQSSLQTNTEIFVTENEEFSKAEKTVQEAIGHRFTEEEYKEYKRYAITTLYNHVSKLLTPLEVNKMGNIVPSQSLAEDIQDTPKRAAEYWNRERSRICGYGITSDGDFTPESLNDPTRSDIERYVRLTPAQKVIFMQRHFPDNQGIFNYIKVTLLNNTDVRYRGISRQYLSYDDQVDDVEDLLYLFSKSFFNRNPLIKLAAVDLIKYAFIAEGFNFKSGYITKIITNDSLYTLEEDGGMDIIRNSIASNSMNDMIEKMPEYMVSDVFIENYVRSHSGVIPVTRMPALPKVRMGQSGFLVRGDNVSTAFNHVMRKTDGLVHINATVPNKLVEGLINKLLLKKGNMFVKVNFPVDDDNSTTVLYKVERRNPRNAEGRFLGYMDYFLVPLNLLDRYETYEYSYNKNYNKFNSREYYRDVVDNLVEEAMNVRNSILKELESEQTKGEKSPVCGRI